ncbi:MAG: tyrosine-type recombinase/integrase [Sphaerochaetaceae bacterium]|nr:tyrosine-type recombinase/integrase [Sphaerochaetaceae bacterium]
MFEKIYLKKTNLRKHLEAPLLKEREEFLSHMEKKKLCLRYLQITSKYLLFAVQELHLKDEAKVIVSFDSIREAGQKWKKMKLSSSLRKNADERVDTKTKDFVCTTVKWLSGIGWINPVYLNDKLIFNRLNKEPAFRLKYLCAPSFKERLAYLNHLEANGMSFSTLREYAEYQLHIIEFLNLTSLHQFSRGELKVAARHWDTIGNGNRLKKRGKRYKTFLAVASGWFEYTNLIISDKPNIPESEKLDAYCNWMLKDKGLSKETIRNRKLELEHFFTYVLHEGNDLKSLNAICLDSYIEKRHNEGCSRRSIATIVTSLKGFLRFAHDQELIQTDLSVMLKSPKLFSLENLPLSPNWEDIQRLIDYYDGTKPRDIRNKAIMVIFVVYGIRCSELENITLRDVDWKNDAIYLHRAKRCRPQILPLLPIVGNALVKYITEIRRNDLSREYLFLDLVAPFTKVKRTTVYNVVASAYKALDIKLNHIGPHSIRHACASHLVNSGCTLKEVSDLLGHSQLDTTRIYAKVDMVNLCKVAEMNWEGLL